MTIDDTDEQQSIGALDLADHRSHLRRALRAQYGEVDLEQIDTATAAPPSPPIQISIARNGFLAVELSPTLVSIPN